MATPPGPKRPPLGVPTWGWLALVGVIALAVVGVVVLKGGDDKSSVVPASTTIATAGSTVTPITQPETVLTTPPTGETVETTETDPQITEPGDSAAVVAGAPAGITGDRENPVPLGTIADIGGGWRLQILEVVPDGAAEVAAESEYNDPPPAGSTFTLVKVAMGYFGLEDPTSSFQPNISAVGASNLQVESGCGQIPNELESFLDVFSGGVVVGNICFVTTPEDSTSLQLYASADYFGDDVFLEASGAAAGLSPLPALKGPQAGAASTPKRLAPTALGTAVDLGEGWTMTVTGAARDITDLVMTENQFNDPAPEGFRFIGVDVIYSYSGTEAASAYQVTSKVVGDDNLELSANCGVVPGEVDNYSDVFAGGSVAGTICFVVPSASPNIVLYASADYSIAPVMFAVT